MTRRPRQRRVRAEGAIGVDHQPDVRSDRLARRGHTLRVLLRVAADLHLHPPDALLGPGAELLGHLRAVVGGEAPGSVDRHRCSHAVERGGQRYLEQARAQVVQRDVDGAQRPGGDALLSGHPDGDDRWRVGIQHPRSVREIALTLGLRDVAIATSGTYMRGAHIHDPVGERTPSGLLSVTIVGPDVATAEAYATAAFAMGARRAAQFTVGRDRCDAVLICEDDTVITTPGIDRLRL